MIRYRSIFEQNLSKTIKRHDSNATYESIKFDYVVLHKYTPDFVLSNGVHLELKGVLTPADRTKLLAVKKQHPEIDLRLVFMNSKNKISKSSRTTYSQWATKHGFLWCDGSNIPPEWFK